MDDYKQKFSDVAEAARTMNAISEKKINEVLNSLADEIESKMYYIISENEKDAQRMDPSNPKYDRLLLDEKRLRSMASDLRNVASLPFPAGRVLEEKELPNQLKLKKITVPFGVIGIVFEARPNVVTDVFSLCFKSGNASILKGGSDAAYSNRALVEIIKTVLDEHEVNPNVCMLLPNDKLVTEQLLKARQYVDLIIPRGGKDLIRFVRENATVPVIETGAGVCHTYFHQGGDKEKGQAIILNAKTRKVSVCNSLDCLIIDKSRLADLPYLCAPLAEKNVVIYADPQAWTALHKHYPHSLLKEADETSFGTEFLDYKMAVKTVFGMDDALNHILRYSSKHSEAIVSEDRQALAAFTASVDAACVYTNVSTAFTDGAQFGLGAEIGISTQKLHARGPMALRELCSYKWIIEGNGQIRL